MFIYTLYTDAMYFDRTLSQRPFIIARFVTLHTNRNLCSNSGAFENHFTRDLTIVKFYFQMEIHENMSTQEHGIYFILPVQRDFDAQVSTTEREGNEEKSIFVINLYAQLLRKLR